ncbi:hypothetical protein, partial [uncultured Alcanivorax sp.]|uniref:hypothetical protein n=1 Tax=uncultured Alcanivorax sp. TaxID=191215 RepID=UPI0030DB1B59
LNMVGRAGFEPATNWLKAIRLKRENLINNNALALNCCPATFANQHDKTLFFRYSNAHLGQINTAIHQDPTWGSSHISCLYCHPYHTNFSAIADRLRTDQVRT